MDDNMFTSGNSSGSLMDFDYMDELLLNGCWLQTTDDPSSSNSLFDPSFQWPALEFNNDPISKNISSDPEANSSKTQVKNLVNLPNQSENLSKLSKRWWIGPNPTLSVTDRLIYAIENIKYYTVDKNLLIQVWLPETIKGKKVLSTSNRLFSLELNCPRLSNYRNISKRYHFSAEGEAKESVGLPGRVFMEKVPEWTPDVRLFKTEEYPRVFHAKEYDVRGSVAVPIFDHNSRNCVGVVEVVMTTQKSNYTPEILSVCQALEAVNLRSSEESNTQKIKVNNGFYHPALPEILEALKSACVTHNLPLAQTWTPCTQQGGKGGCRHSNENLIHCISTVDYACYVSDHRFKDFHEACSEHHLLKGQGVVGRAFAMNKPCYTPDVTLYSKTEYPLAHHARIFDLHAAVAIRLRTTYGAMVDFVLEFFLPVDCKNHEVQKDLLSSLSDILRNVCQSLRIVTEMELKEEAVNDELFVVSDIGAVQKAQERVGPHPGPDPGSGLGPGPDHGLGLGPDPGLVLGSGSGGGPDPGSVLGSGLGFGLDAVSASGLCSGSGSGVEKKRAGAKMEKSITLETLRKHFAGSLKDAAKHIGVCPTTLKRICRQHGIQRWPSRKIKKVGHSLKKIQLVMDSVHGGSGSFQIDSFYSNFPKLASSYPSKPIPITFSAPKTETFDGLAAATSCSQSSSSAQSSSSGTHQVSPDTDHGALPHVQEPKLSEPLKTQNLPPKPRIMRDGDQQRVKVTFGEQKVRFRMQKDWGYDELTQEITKRFSLNDISGYHLKYFDDDSDWVLLTCDADLEECIDVYRSFKGGTIKLHLREAQLRVGSSLGSNAPL